MDKTISELEILTLQNDLLLKITSELWKHACVQKYPNLRDITLGHNFIFPFNLVL